MVPRAPQDFRSYILIGLKYGVSTLGLSLRSRQGMSDLAVARRCSTPLESSSRSFTTEVRGLLWQSGLIIAFLVKLRTHWRIRNVHNVVPRLLWFVDQPFQNSCMGYLIREVQRSAWYVDPTFTDRGSLLTSRIFRDLQPTRYGES